jgi:hypothetical protein
MYSLVDHVPFARVTHVTVKRSKALRSDAGQICSPARLIHMAPDSE